LEKLAFILIPTDTQHAQKKRILLTREGNLQKLTPPLINSNDNRQRGMSEMLERKRFTKSKVGNPKQKFRGGEKCLLNIFGLRERKGSFHEK
jgi:hypothetical protein